jgi:LuxR family maltose regulon positive regulatory protein
LADLHSAICDSRLILLSAPPGYGKSTLLNLWLQVNGAGILADRELRAVYLSLDASENDRTHFLLALIAALQMLHPECGRRAKTFLTQNGYPEMIDSATQTQILAGLVVIDIAQYLPNRFVLILDNYEQITEPAVHSALNYLLRRLPAQAHVVVSTTQDPPLSLAKMRAHGLATVLRAAELAFDEAESAAFLEKVAGVNLPAAQQLALYRYTEGWPAGLHLLAQELRALSQEAARTLFIASLDDEHEPPVIWPTLEAYLREELFDNLPRSLRTFLMQTSILKVLRADACQAVTGCQDAEQLLQESYQRNLFLFRCSMTQDNDGRADVSHSQPLFRCHTLFAAFLRRRLYQEMPDQMLQLHRRAAEAEHEPVQKVRHYLAAQCWAEAAQVVASIHEGGDWPGDQLAKLARSAGEMPAYLRQVLTGRRQSAPGRPLGPAAIRLGFTVRQLEVLALLDDGASNRAIANELFITLATVKGHISEIMRKLEVGNRREAVRRAAEMGLLHP